MPTVSVIIPTLNAGQEIHMLLDSLLQQTVKPDEILVIDSSSDDNTVQIVDGYPAVKTIVIDRKDFNHGLTRHLGAEMTSGDFICFMTQDAIPATGGYLENLIKPLKHDDSVALSSGRQLPKKDARRFEQLVREFNYPSKSNVRSIKDLDACGIKTFFASDVCAAYRRTAYLKCGGFSHVNTSEDMLMAAKFISAGYKIAYASDACVYHSHNLKPKEQYKRNKEVGYFLQAHEAELLGAREVSEGARLVKMVTSSLIREKRFLELGAFVFDCGARFLGNRAGRKNFKKSAQKR